ncbi:MAG: hypothetical protein KDD84_12320, partial [Caldilineaceae bacterium]|nr:hypothetical protein [Caldilineaceae bacterium]
MLQKRIPAWTLIAVVAAVLLIFGIGSAIHSAGWSDGFMMGLMAGGNVDGGSLAPYLAYQNGHGWQGSGIGGFFGGLFRFLFFLFMIVLFFRLLGFLRWRMGGRGPWHHHRHGWHHGDHHG